MSFFILPKIINNIFLELTYDNNIYFENLSKFVSPSLFYYYDKNINQINKLLYESNDKNEDDLNNNNKEIVDFFLETMNPYFYVYSNGLNKNSISKIKTESSLFYEFLEIMNLNLTEKNNANIDETEKTTIDNNTLNKNLIEINKNYDITLTEVNKNNLFITPYCNDIINCIEVTEILNNSNNLFYADISSCLKEFDFNDNEKKFNLMFFDNNINNDIELIYNFIKIIIIILNNQLKDGITLIKLNKLDNKIIIELIYYLSSIYDKVIIIKPSISNIINNDKYLLCKKFNVDECNKREIHTLNLNELINVDRNKLCKIHSILKYKLPYFYINKIEEINLVLGQQQLETIDQIINAIKSKNKEEKFENNKKNNIQKSINWCEKFNIPFNKQTEKTNIFLVQDKSN